MGFEGGIRSRKDALVPMDEEEFKIEIVDVVGSIEEYQMLSLGAHQIVEVMTSSPTQSLLEGTRPRKRAKLDHLSPDQKTQHRKMMNRMSAQSARDRQRAQMVLQEQALKEQFALNNILKEENRKLKASNEALVAENESLKKREEDNAELQSLVEKLRAELEQKESRVGGGGDEISELDMPLTPSSTSTSVSSPEETIREEVGCDSMEPAVPSTVPLPKGLESQLIFLFTLLIWEACFRWASTHPNSSKLSKTSLNKSSVRAQSQLWNKPLQQKSTACQALFKVPQLMWKTEQLRGRPPD